MPIKRTIIGSLCLIPLVLGCTSTGWGPSTPEDPAPYRSRVHRTEFNVPIVLNERTAAWIKFYQGRGRKNFARHLERSYRYVPAMKKILRQHGLPDDLVYIALIESGFNAKAYSHARAAGFWQFIAPTGRRYKLKINRSVDERRDFVKATHAAANYLKDLHQMFGHWYLAAAGYNAGEGKIMRAIKKYHTRDFWEIAKGNYLRPETKNYIPKYLAAMIIAKHPKRFGFGDLVPQEPLEYETVEIRGTPIDLRVAARLIERDQKELATLNPELLTSTTPTGRKSYALRVPRDSVDRFRSEYDLLPNHMRMAQKEHTVKSGETLDALAKHHGMSRDYLALANGISKKSRLEPGQRLGVPYKPPKNRWAYSGNVHYHRVRSGDSLWKIARKYNVPLKKLRAWNKGRIGRYLKPGQKIAIRGKAAKSKGGTRYASGSRPSQTIKYRVKSGDSLWSVANKHGVTVAQLKSWNQGKIGKYLKKGQRLKIKGKRSGGAKSSRSVVAGGTYRVKSGDSLWSIAQRNNVRVSDLKAWNGDSLGKHLKPGQRLKIVKASASPAPARKTVVAKATPRETSPRITPAVTTVEKRKMIFHTISSGDTLWDIARKYGVRTSEIKQWNGIDEVKRLRPGNKLKIYVKPDGRTAV